jgi:hypothetical protein
VVHAFKILYHREHWGSQGNATELTASVLFDEMEAPTRQAVRVSMRLGLAGLESSGRILSLQILHSALQ